jgi:hypothetical protein
MYLQLLSGATATNSAPSGATAGVDRKQRNAGSHSGIAEATTATVLVTGTGTGALSVTLKIWGYSPVSGEWHPLGTATSDANRGRLNEQNAIGGTNTIRHAELVQGLGAFTRFYLEVVAISGTECAVDAWLVAAGVRA